YNSLPHPEDQPEITDRTLIALGELFVQHRVHDIFGIHLLHSHFTAPEGSILLGVKFQMSGSTKACWTKPVAVTELKTASIHGHVFHVRTDGTFVPYEFHEGDAASKAAMVGPAFFQGLAAFLHRNKLTGLVALQALEDCRQNTNMELQIGPEATVMLDERDVVGMGAIRMTTGWSFRVADDGIISCKGNDVYAPKTNSNHQVFKDSKPLPDVEALKAALRNEGVIA
ncbi:hypothetical protein NA57DRAFT_49665, partial [Rhizodiscina lignyota]